LLLSLLFFTQTIINSRFFLLIAVSFTITFVLSLFYIKLWFPLILLLIGFTAVLFDYYDVVSFNIPNIYNINREIINKFQLYASIMLILYVIVLFTFLISSLNILYKKLETSKVNLTKKDIELSSIFYAFPDTLVKLNKEGIILTTYTHSDLEHILPLHKNIGKNIKDLMQERNKYFFEENLNISVKNKQLTISEYIYNDKDNIYYFEIKLIPLNDKEIICIIRDISETKTLRKSFINNLK
ncbi:MAG: hypothetical protein ACOCV8_01815, partial [Spirochaetota bacterium]